MLFLIVWLVALKIYLDTTAFLKDYERHKLHIVKMKAHYKKASYKDFAGEFNKHEWCIDRSSMCKVLRNSKRDCRVYDDIFIFQGEFMLMPNAFELSRCSRLFNKEYKKLKEGI